MYLQYFIFVQKGFYIVCRQQNNKYICSFRYCVHLVEIILRIGMEMIIVFFVWPVFVVVAFVLLDHPLGI